MSSEIGYGAATIKAGEVRYHEALAKLVKSAAHPKSDGTAPSTIVTDSSTAAHVGKTVDVKA